MTSLYCPEVPGLVCGRDHHTDCRRRALAAIEQERRNGGVRLSPRWVAA